MNEKPLVTICKMALSGRPFHFRRAIQILHRDTFPRGMFADGVWGAEWTAEDVNSTDFGVGISASDQD